jgi:hypothetical protein
MFIKEMSESDCFNALRRASRGRLACSHDKTTEQGEIVDHTFRLTLDVAVILYARPANAGHLRLGRQVCLKLSDDRLGGWP